MFKGFGARGYDFEECFEDLELVDLILMNFSRIWGWRGKEAKGRGAMVKDGELCGAMVMLGGRRGPSILQKSAEI